MKFVWNTAADKFQYDSGAWNSTTVNACANEVGAMAVGVYMKAHHDTITGILDETVTVSDHAVMKFEPLKWENCKPGTHA